MALASNPTASIASASPGEARRTLAVTGVNHALHDGYTDLIYVLLPVWQAEFGLDYVALALLRSLYNGALAALQMPASRLARSFGARTVLMLGTLLSAGGYAVAGASGGLIGLGLGLLLGGAGSSTQHPLASAVIARAYGSAARGPLGTGFRRRAQTGAAPRWGARRTFPTVVPGRRNGSGTDGTAPSRGSRYRPCPEHHRSRESSSGSRTRSTGRHRGRTGRRRTPRAVG